MLQLLHGPIGFLCRIVGTEATIDILGLIILLLKFHGFEIGGGSCRCTSNLPNLIFVKRIGIPFQDIIGALNAFRVAVGTEKVGNSNSGDIELMPGDNNTTKCQQISIQLCFKPI